MSVSSRKTKPAFTRQMRVRITVLTVAALALLFTIIGLQMHSMGTLAERFANDEGLDQIQASLTQTLQADKRFATQILAHWYVTGEVLKELDGHWRATLQAAKPPGAANAQPEFAPEPSLTIVDGLVKIGFQASRGSPTGRQVMTVRRVLSAESLAQWVHHPETDITVIGRSSTSAWTVASTSFSEDRVKAVSTLVRDWGTAAQWQGTLKFADGKARFRSLPLGSGDFEAVVLFTQRSQSTQDMMQAIRERLSLVGMIGIGLLSALAFMLASSIIKPVSRLVRATDAIAQGDLDYQIRLNRDDEMGLLAQSIESMRANLKQRTVELQKLVDADPLTGVLSRRAFEEKLHKAVGKHARVALILIDLDNFKRVNDEHGHAAGDVVLKVVAERLRRQVGHGGHVGRLGGDEFGILLVNIDTPKVRETCMAILPILHATITATIDGQRVPLHVGASIGHADTTSDRTSDVEKLSHLADQRMYHLKEINREVSRIANNRKDVSLETNTAIFV